jgi:hypothetical protein
MASAMEIFENAAGQFCGDLLALRGLTEERQGGESFAVNALRLKDWRHVTPGSFQIFFNTILGEASRQLRVTGHLIDGFALDITSKRYGTTYGSTNLQVASFGPEDGRIYAGQDGVATIQVGNHGFSATAQVTVQTFNPQALSFLRVPGYPNNVALSGDYAFIAAGYGGLVAVDVADPLRPFTIATLSRGSAFDVRIVGDYAFVASGLVGLVAFDVRDPGHLRIVGEEAVAGVANDLVVTGGRAYVADEQGLSVVDVSDPAHPHFLGAVPVPGRARGVDVSGGVAVLAAEDGGVFVIDVNDPENPVVLGSTATRADGTSSAADVAPTIAVTAPAAGARGKEREPLLLHADARDDVRVASVRFVANGQTVFTDYDAPYEYTLTVPSGVADLRIGAVATDGGGNEGSAQEIIVPIDPNRAPVAALVAPVSGQTVVDGTTVPIVVQASDDRAVTRMEIYVGGTLQKTLSAPPYRLDYTVPIGTPQLSIRAIAYDDVGPSQPADLTLAVHADGPPSAAVLLPQDGSEVVEGSPLTIVAGVSDDVGVQLVRFLVDGTEAGFSIRSPFSWSIAAPAAGTTSRIQVVAVDTRGHEAAGLGGFSFLGGALDLGAAGLAGKGKAPADRLAKALRVRTQAAEHARSRGTETQRENGDEGRLPGVACYSKGLPHDKLGVADPKAYGVLLAALRTGRPEDFERIPLGGFVKLANPQAALAFDLLGPDASQPACPPAPGFSSPEQAAEAVELYWKALARDVPFAEYEGNPLIQEAAGELSQLSGFHGPKAGGKVTPRTIFRGVTAGDLAGPYLSQFLWKPIPWLPLKVEQKIRTAVAGVDFMTGVEDWLAIQNGALGGVNRFDTVPRYIRNGRDLGEYVHRDFTYQGFQAACLIALKAGTLPDGGNPYKHSRTQGSFTTFGQPYLLYLLAVVTQVALKACWYQKWLVHRRIRPEEYGGRVEMVASGRAEYPLPAGLLDTRAVEAVRRRYGTALLPQAYPEGCPTHPSYPAGHAVIAGACATVLKACLDESHVIPEPVVASADGLTLQPWKGADLTVGGELDKLASNTALGRNFAGLHWRSDGWEGMRLGEEVAIRVLEELRYTGNELFSGWSLKKLNGERVSVA